MMAVSLLGAASLVVVWMVLPLWQTPNLTDDAFITLTYAKNLVAGRGFIFNAPPASLGTTTPFFTLLVSAVAGTTGLGVIHAALFIDTASWIACGWLAYVLLLSIDGSSLIAALVGVSALLLARDWLPFAGMEFHLFEALLLAAIYLAIHGKEVYCGLTVAALTLTRGEGALVALMLLGYLWRARGALPLRYVASGAAAAAAWCLYAGLTFGTPIPNTLAAKRSQMHLPGATSFFRRLLGQLLPQHVGAFSLAGLSFANAYVPAVLWGAVTVLRRWTPVSLLLVWSAAYVVAYTALGPKAYGWYVLPVIFVCQILAGLGLASGFRWANGIRRRSWRVFACAAVALVTAGAFYPTLRYTVMFAREFSGDPRADSYRELAAWLKTNTPPDTSVAFTEIGYLGFYSDRRIVDLLGLVDPAVVEHVASEDLGWALRHYRPEYYVEAQEITRTLRAKLESELADYVEIFHVDRSGGKAPLRVLRRADAAPSPPPLDGTLDYLGPDES